MAVKTTTRTGSVTLLATRSPRLMPRHSTAIVSVHTTASGMSTGATKSRLNPGAPARTNSVTKYPVASSPHAWVKARAVYPSAHAMTTA